MHYILDYESSFHDKKGMAIDGAIFDARSDIVPNVFNAGDSLGDMKFKIVAQEKYTRIGRLTDKVAVQVNRSTLLFIVSQKAIGILKSLNIGDVEFLDVEITGMGLTLTDYKIVNILERIDCVNDEKSELIYYTGMDKIYAIERLVLSDDMLPDHLDIFQIDRMDKNITVVSERFVERVNENRLTGFKFVTPEKFTIG
jgi:hypothetical protein